MPKMQTRKTVKPDGRLGLTTRKTKHANGQKTGTIEKLSAEEWSRARSDEEKEKCKKMPLTPG